MSILTIRGKERKALSDVPTHRTGFGASSIYTSILIIVSLSRFLQADDRARTSDPQCKGHERICIRELALSCFESGHGDGLQGFDITQAEFASRIGVRQSYLSAVERERGEVGAEVLLGISLGFGKSLEWLFRGEEWFGLGQDTGPALLIKGEATVNE